MARLNLHLTVWGFCLLAGIANGQTIWYVDDNASPGGDGLSWTTARQTVQAGLDGASEGDEVWVAAGIYVERITLKTGVALYGGFVGTESARDQRDWTQYETVLNGDRGKVVTSPAGATPATRIDGFTIHNGEAYGGNGAGIYCYNSSPTIANNIIRDSDAGDHGGGIFCYQSSAVITNNLLFDNGGGNYGGAICCFESSPTIVGNTITSNRSGGGEHGGGIACLSGSAPLIMANLIVGNVSAGFGGGIYCHQSDAIIVSNVITGNQAATDGGGIYCSSSSPTLVNNTITRNEAIEDGGGIGCNEASPLIANTIVAFNSSGIFHEGVGTTTLRHNCLYANSEYAVSGLLDPIGTDGNFSADPRIAGAAFGDLHIQADSPCVNAGTNDIVQADWTDRDKQKRIHDGVVDIGADESDGTVWPDTTGSIVRVSTSGSDLNDGSSWSQAKLTVQAGIDAATAASVEGGEVWVEAGTYMERIALKGYAHVFGGFDGTETLLAQRERDNPGRPPRQSRNSE